MKRASRFMPKFEPGEAGGFVVFVLIAVITTAVALAFYKPVILGGLAGLVLLGIVWEAIERPRMEKYFSGLRESRKGLSICDFAKEFDLEVVDTWVVRAVYEQVQAALPTSQKIPIKASDDLFATLKLDEDDLDLSLMGEIAQRTGRSLDNYERNPYYGKVTTVRYLVLFFNQQAHVVAR